MDGHQHAGRNPSKLSATEFFYESVNSPLEESINSKGKLFSNAITVHIENKISFLIIYLTALSSAM